MTAVTIKHSKEHDRLFLKYGGTLAKRVPKNVPIPPHASVKITSMASYIQCLILPVCALPKTQITNVKMFTNTKNTKKSL